MHETLDQLERLRRAERRVVMATLVAARGTTPEKAGARMWVGAGGALLGSVTIGGCVDARVIAAADEVLASGQRTLLTMPLGDADAWELGLTCGGDVDVLLEPLDLDGGGDAVVRAYDAARAELDLGRSVVLVGVLRGAPGGSRLVVREDGPASGSLGVASLDEAAAREAGAMLRDAASLPMEIAVRDAPDADATLWLERLAPVPTLVVYGATPVAMALVPFARALGMRTIVVDGRERLATQERFPDATEIRVGMPSEIADTIPAGRATSIVVVAHDYKYELPVLGRALRGDAGYIGMLGSRRRGAAVKRLLAEDGLTEEELARLHTPIGLDLGGRSPAEIALAIAAEIVAVRHGRSARPAGASCAS